MKKLFLIVVMILLLAGGISWAVDSGTVTVTEETFSYVKKIKFGWTTTTVANGQTAVKTTSESYSGQVVRLVTIPDGTTAPTALYGVTVTDEDGADILLTLGSGRSATATEQVIAPNLGYVANDRLTLTVTSGGGEKKGTTILYIR